MSMSIKRSTIHVSNSTFAVHDGEGRESVVTFSFSKGAKFLADAKNGDITGWVPSSVAPKKTYGVSQTQAEAQYDAYIR